MYSIKKLEKNICYNYDQLWVSFEVQLSKKRKNMILLIIYAITIESLKLHLMIFFKFYLEFNLSQVSLRVE